MFKSTYILPFLFALLLATACSDESGEPDPCSAFGPYDCMTATGIACDFATAHRMEKNGGSCRGVEEIAYCVSPDNNWRTSGDQDCAVDPDYNCWCGLHRIPDGWKWADESNHPICTKVSVVDWESLVLCMPYTCFAYPSYELSEADENCECYGAKQLFADDTCYVETAACVPVVPDRNTNLRQAAVMDEGHGCYVWYSSYIPPHLIDCASDSLDSQQQEFCTSCAQHVSLSIQDDWPLCDAD